MVNPMQYATQLQHMTANPGAYDIWGYLWGKLAYGAQLFATALTHESIADAFADANYRGVYIALAQEILQVAIANQITPERFNGFDPAAFMPGARYERALKSLQEMSRLIDDRPRPIVGCGATSPCVNGARKPSISWGLSSRMGSIWECPRR